MAAIIPPLVGGLGLFLYGLSRAQSGLEGLAGGRTKAVLSLATRRKSAAVLTGFFLTTLTQSSSAVAVMLVGLVSTGLVQLGGAIPALLGADVATTLTVQILAFDIQGAALIGVGIGVLLIMSARGSSTQKSIGKALLGLGLIFFGMHLMKEAAGPIAESKRFSAFIVTLSDYPILAILVGTLGTAIVQSSGAMIGLILALASKGALELDSAIPLMLGANIGTAATGALAAISSNLEGRRVAASHIAMKLAGVIVVIIVLGPFIQFSEYLGHLTGSESMRTIAIAHTTFNVGKLFLLLPFSALFAKFAIKLFPDKNTQVPRRALFLTDTSHAMPEVILIQTAQETAHVAEMTKELFERTITTFHTHDAAEIDYVRRADDDIDALHDAIIERLRDLGGYDLSGAQTQEIGRLLFIIRDIERSADIISLQLASESRRMVLEDMNFSVEGWLSIESLSKDVIKIFGLLVSAITQDADLITPQELSSELSRFDLRIRETDHKHLMSEAAGIKEALNSDAVFSNTLGEMQMVERTIITALATACKFNEDALYQKENNGSDPKAE